jgi:amino acid transporter
MKWFVYAVALFPLLFVAAQMLSSIFPTEEDWASFLVVMGGLLLIPVSMGMSILRYRLYDIDRVVNKTLVYAALTAVLVAGYAAGVLLMQSVLPLPEDSEIVIATSTLAMAALFRPLRARVQVTVDRRFYRARYDAAHAIQDFGERLRQQTNLDSLTSDLIGVTARTVQPAHASVWLRTSETAK